MLRCGDAYHLKFRTLHGRPKYKFCILCSTEGHLSFLLINSQPTELERRHVDYIRSQVVIDAGRHKFLKHDSYIDCTDPIGMSERDAQAALERDPRSVNCGQVEVDVLANVIAAVDGSKLLKALDKVRFLKSLRSVIGAESGE